MAFIWLLLYLVVLYLRPGEWIPFFAHWRLLPLVTAGSLFFLGFQMAITKQPPPKVPHTRLLLGLFAAVLGSQLIHGYMAGVTSGFNDFLPNVVVYLLIANIVNSQAKFKMTLWLLVLLSVFMAVQGIQQYKTGVGWAGQPLIWEGGPHGRITWIGIFEDPNDLALVFVIVVPLLLSVLFKPSFFMLKLIPMMLLGLLVYGTYLTNSRGGALALAASVAFFLIQRSRWKVPGTFFGGLCALLLFIFGPSRVGGSSEMDDSAYGRLDAWYHGFQLLKSNPLLGAGHDMFTDDFPLTAHNSFVLAFAELGLVGFFFWVALLYVAFRGLSALGKHPNPFIRTYAPGLQASLVGFASAAFFLSRTYIVLPYLLVALCAALNNMAQREAPEYQYVFTRWEVRNVLWTCLGIFVLLQMAMKAWL